MHSRTSRSFLAVLLALLAGFALVAGACTSDDGDSSSDKDSEAETAGDAGDSGTDDSSTDDSSTDDSAPVASEDFSAAVAEATQAVEDTEDPCDLYTAVGSLSTVGNPETQEQTREAVDFYVALLNKMADTSSDPAVADTLRSGATEFQAYAESVDYDPEKMNLSGTGPEIENADALDEAMNSYANTEFADCELPAGITPEGVAPGE